MTAPAVPHFALAPAFANPDVLNYSDQSAAKLFKSGTEPLSIKFDCKPDNLQLFLDQARDKSIVFDWLNILSIPIGGDVAATKDLIESYGEISYEDVKAHAVIYMNEDSREAQDSFMFYHCLMLLRNKSEPEVFCSLSCLVEKAQAQCSPRSSSWCHMWIQELPSQVSEPSFPVLIVDKTHYMG